MPTPQQNLVRSRAADGALRLIRRAAKRVVSGEARSAVHRVDEQPVRIAIGAVPRGRSSSAWSQRAHGAVRDRLAGILVSGYEAALDALPCEPGAA